MLLLDALPLQSPCPKSVQIYSLGKGTQLSYAQTADSEKNNQSGLLLRSWNKQ